MSGIFHLAKHNFILNWSNSIQMKDILQSVDIKRKRLFVFFALAFVLIFFYGSQLFSDKTSPHYGSYVAKPSPRSPITSPLTEHTPTIRSRLHDLQENEAAKIMKKANVTISIITLEDGEKVIKVNYPASTETRLPTKRNLFVEVEQIKKSLNNVFFIESRCATKRLFENYKHNKGFVLNARQCCAIESTAYKNLDKEVYVFHSCPLSDDFLDHSPKFVTSLFSYPNVHAVRFDSAQVFHDTPVQELHQRGQLENSQYPVEHSSDVLRLALLWKFGGTYCDLDVVTVRSLNGLKSNWAGMEDAASVANGVLNVEPGHTVLRKALDHINLHFDGNKWSINGPLLVTPLILRECNVSTVTEAVHHCHGNFTVYDSPVLYPLYYSRAHEFFNEAKGSEVVRYIKKLSSYSVHIWNKISHDFVAKVGSTQAYSLLADEFCPQVYQTCGTRF